MAELYIVGQAPARTGDGRPFTGLSGQRLQQLFGFNSYDYMAARVNLLNLLPDMAPPIAHGRGDHFDYDRAKQEARRLLKSWLLFTPETHVLACGTKVYKCFVGHSARPFQGTALKDRNSDSVVKLWLFPHPSGASSFWNDPKNVAEARAFARKRLRIAVESLI